jgi:hypothetical protein
MVSGHVCGDGTRMELLTEESRATTSFTSALQHVPFGGSSSRGIIAVIFSTVD